MAELRLRGRYRLRHGLWTRAGSNIVTKRGRGDVAKWLAGIAVDAPTHIAYGSSATTPDELQTALQGTEHDRVAFTGSEAEVTDVIFTADAEFTLPDAGQTVREFGLFNAASVGNMFARFICESFVTNGADPILVTWELTIE